MKKSSKNRRIGKRMLCVLLCVICALTSASVLGSDVYAVANDTISNTHGYYWTRVTSEKTLEEAILTAVNVSRKKAGKTEYTSFSDLDDSIDSDEDWARCMILWQDGDNWYFIGKGGNSSDEEITGQVVVSSYGIDPGADNFVTYTGLDTIWIKASEDGTDKKYTSDNGHQYAFRFAEAGQEVLSDYFIAGQLSFYGIKWHSAAYGEFATEAKVGSWNNGKGKHTASCCYERFMTTSLCFPGSWTDYYRTDDLLPVLTSKQVAVIQAMYNHHEYQTSCFGNSCYQYEVNDSTEYRISWAYKNLTDTSKYDLTVLEKTYTNSEYPNGLSGEAAYDKIFTELNEYYYSVNHDTEDGTVWMCYSGSGATGNRYWIQDGNKVEVDSSGSDKCGYYIYIGQDYEVPTYSSGKYTLPAGVTKFEDNVWIKESATIVVGRGSTLIINGHVVNDGYIYVNGGTLIVKGILDNSPESDDFKQTLITYRQTYNKSGYYFAGFKLGHYGDIGVYNSGVVEVMSGGAIVSRRCNTYIKLDNGTVEVFGSLITPRLHLQNASCFTGRRGSLVAVGAVATASYSADYMEEGALYNARDKKLKLLIDLAGAEYSPYEYNIFARYNDGSDVIDNSKNGLFIYAGCDFRCYGIFAMANPYCQETQSYFNKTASTWDYYWTVDFRHTIGHAMRMW